MCSAEAKFVQRSVKMTYFKQKKMFSGRQKVRLLLLLRIIWYLIPTLRTGIYLALPQTFKGQASWYFHIGKILSLRV